MSDDHDKSAPVSRTDSYLDEKAHDVDVNGSTEYIHADLRALDVGLALAAGHEHDADLSPEESGRLRRKCDWHLLPLLCAIYTGAPFASCAAVWVLR